MIRFSCPKCQKTFQVDDTLAGRQAKCSQCKETISIPTKSALEAVDRANLVTAQKAVIGVSSNSNQRPPILPSANQAPQDKRHGRSSSGAASKSEESTKLNTATKVVIAFGATVILLMAGLFGWLIFSFQSGDTWEPRNAVRIWKMLDEAKNEAQSDPLKAYRVSSDVVKEAKQHVIKDEKLVKAIADAEKFRTDTEPRIAELVRAEEADKKRLAEEQANRAKEERLRIADNEQREKEEKEALRLAEQKIQEQEKRKKEAMVRYAKAPQTARSALNAIKKLQARTEIGINFRDYSTVVGETYAEVKVFCESPDGESIPEFSAILLSAIDKFKLGMDVWKGKMDFTETARFHEIGSEHVLQECWSAAGRRISVAEQLLKKEGLEAGLPNYETLMESDSTYSKKMKTIKFQLLSLHLRQEMVKLSNGEEAKKSEYDEKLQEFSQALAELEAQDSIK